VDEGERTAREPRVQAVGANVHAFALFELDEIHKDAVSLVNLLAFSVRKVRPFHWPMPSD
jgi:hypothetical protein